MESKKQSPHFEILPFGEKALLVNFEQIIDETINQEAMNLAKALCAENINGVEYVQAAYCSLTVGYNRRILSFSCLRSIIFNLKNKNGNAPVVSPKKIKRIPVCYDEEYAPDLFFLEKKLNISTEKIIELHTSVEYRIYMLGFLPGFPYMGKLPNELNCPRKEVPRKKVPTRSVGLAGAQTGIYPISAPGGWQIIGRTPIDIFDVEKENPFYFKVGNLVQFYPISKKEYIDLSG